MKKGLLVLLSFSMGSLFADSIHLRNNTGLEAYFTMYYPSGTAQGPFCAPPGELMYADAITYRGMKAYVIGPNGVKEECFISPNLMSDIRQPGLYNHNVVIERCSNPTLCGGKNFQVKKSAMRVTERPKRAQAVCEKTPVLPVKEIVKPAVQVEAPPQEFRQQLESLKALITALKSEVQEGELQKGQSVTHNYYIYLQGNLQRADKSIMSVLGQDDPSVVPRTGMIASLKRRLASSWINFRDKMRCLGNPSCSREDRIAAAKTFLKAAVVIGLFVGALATFLKWRKKEPRQVGIIPAEQAVMQERERLIEREPAPEAWETPLRHREYEKKEGFTPFYEFPQ